MPYLLVMHVSGCTTPMTMPWAGEFIMDGVKRAGNDRTLINAIQISDEEYKRIDAERAKILNPYWR